MKISKSHKRFSERLEQPDALTEPEKYLGPNWQDVLNFWIYVDTLSNQDKKEMKVCFSATNAAWGAADDVIGEDFSEAAWRASYDTTGFSVFGRATVELIGSHKLLEQNKILKFLPICVKL